MAEYEGIATIENIDTCLSEGIVMVCDSLQDGFFDQ